MMKLFGNLLSGRNGHDDQSLQTAESEKQTQPHSSGPPTLHVIAWVREQKLETIQSEFHMTIRTKVSELSTKQASMLLMVCNVLALRDGMDLTLYLSIEWLLSFITRSGNIRPEEIKEEKYRQTCLLADLILLSFRGEWNGLDDRYQYSRETIEEIVATGWLPDKRTFNSWIQHWDPNRFLEFRIVPMENLMNRSSYSEPYSGYCKGYGEATRGGRESTPFSDELDGIDLPDRLPEFNLLEVQAYQTILLAIEQEKARRIQNRID